MRRGVRLGVDVGDVRIGVARCDPGGMLASPAEVVPRQPDGRRSDKHRSDKHRSDRHRSDQPRPGTQRGEKSTRRPEDPRAEQPNTERPDLDRIVAIALEEEAIEVIVGLPIGLSGSEGPAAVKARTYAGELASRLRGIPVRLIDERLSTVSAHQAFRSQGQSTRRTRGRVDAAAAAVILQSALDSERSTGEPPGEVVTGAHEEREKQGP